MPLLVIFLVVNDSVLALFQVPPELMVTFLSSLVPVALVKIIVPETEVVPVIFSDAAPTVSVPDPIEIPVAEILPALIETEPEGTEKFPNELKLFEPEIELVPDISRDETIKVLSKITEAEPSMVTDPACARVLMVMT